MSFKSEGASGASKTGISYAGDPGTAYGPTEDLMKFLAGMGAQQGARRDALLYGKRGAGGKTPGSIFWDYSNLGKTPYLNEKQPPNDGPEDETRKKTGGFDQQKPPPPPPANAPPGGGPGVFSMAAERPGVANIDYSMTPPPPFDQANPDGGGGGPAGGGPVGGGGGRPTRRPVGGGGGPVGGGPAGGGPVGGGPAGGGGDRTHKRVTGNPGGIVLGGTPVRSDELGERTKKGFEKKFGPGYNDPGGIFNPDPLDYTEGDPGGILGMYDKWMNSTGFDPATLAAIRNQTSQAARGASDAALADIGKRFAGTGNEAGYYAGRGAVGRGAQQALADAAQKTAIANYSEGARLRELGTAGEKSLYDTETADFNNYLKMLQDLTGRKRGVSTISDSSGSGGGFDIGALIGALA
jgi:hypothetical protein